MQINFSNNRHFTTGSTIPLTRTGSLTQGIAIYSQRYAVNEINTEGLSVGDISNVLKNVFTYDDALNTLSTFSSTDLEAYQTVLDKLDYVEVKDDTSNDIKNAFVLDKNQIVFFESNQGQIKRNGAADYSQYKAYYGFLKDDAENTWLIYIIRKDHNSSIEGDQTPEYYPVVFKIKDNLAPLFTKSTDKVKVSGVDTDVTYVNGVDCTIFKIGRSSATTNMVTAGRELKNTSFNLSYEETKEGLADIKPYCAFKLASIAPGE